MPKLFYPGVMLAGVLVSAFAQVLLKKSALKQHLSFWSQFLNWRVFTAYSIFVIAIFCSIIAYKEVPLSIGPILASTEYIFIAFLDRVVFKKHASATTLTGLGLIVIGIVISAT